MTDEKLVRRILHKSDRAAADELIGRYYDEIYRFAYRQSAYMADPKNTAQDLTQEVFMSMLRSLSTFDARRAGFRTWLYRVASSRIIDARRKFHANEVQIDETELFAETDLAVDLYNADFVKKIEEYISTQPSDIQRVLRLHLYNDMTFAQIATAMDIPESTVKTKFYRNLKKLKEVFMDDYNPKQ